MVGTASRKSILSKLNRRSLIGRVRRHLVDLIHSLDRMEDNLDAGRKSRVKPTSTETERNRVMPDIWKRPIFQELIPLRLAPSNDPVALLGDPNETNALAREFKKQGRAVIEVEWDWTAEPSFSDVPNPSPIIVCKTPLNDAQWRVIRKLKASRACRVWGLQELVLPYTVIEQAQAKLDYHVKDFESIFPKFLGKDRGNRQTISKLDAVYPLAGKRIIEFGPMDGYQTVALADAGAKHVTCVEAHAVNLIKTMIACYTFNLDNVSLVMDDFHNADNYSYGSFDLAYAHGVYYHSAAPFFFLENLMSLAPTIFVGGYCATDSLPAQEWQVLEYQRDRYRVKQYMEARDFTAGVNPLAYYFDGEDLMRFFTTRDYEVVLIDDQVSTITAGRYLRFIASRASTQTMP